MGFFYLCQNLSVVSIWVPHFRWKHLFFYSPSKRIKQKLPRKWAAIYYRHESGVGSVIDCRSCLKRVGKTPELDVIPENIFSRDICVQCPKKKLYQTPVKRVSGRKARSSGNISFPMKSSGENRANSAWERFGQIAFGWRMPTTKMEEPCDKCNINANRAHLTKITSRFFSTLFFFPFRVRLAKCSSDQ